MCRSLASTTRFGAATSFRRAISSSTISTFKVSAEVTTKFSDNFQFIGRLRAIYDPLLYDGFNAADVAQYQGGIADGGGYRGDDTGRPNYYGAKARNGKNINPLEISGRNYIVDLPTFVLDYKYDNINVRVGNQQIAWGQAIFLQTFDVPNGLDLRRHLILDRAIEEFEDERVPKLSIRATMQATSEIVLDGYVGKFQPSILPNPNTSYNVIPSQFYKPLDNYYLHNYDWKIDYGMRLKADYGQFGYSAFAASRYNPLGAFRWAKSGINKGLVGGFGALVESAYLLKAPGCSAAAYNPSLCRNYDSVGAALAEAPFTVGPAGVYSGDEWFATAGSVRLDGLEALNTVIAEFPALQDIYASQVADVDQAQEPAQHLLPWRRWQLARQCRARILPRGSGRHRRQLCDLVGQRVAQRDHPESGNPVHAEARLHSEKPQRWLRQGRRVHRHRRCRKVDALVGSLPGGLPGVRVPASQRQRSGRSESQGLRRQRSQHRVRECRPASAAPTTWYSLASSRPRTASSCFEWAFLYDIQGGLLAQPEVQWNIGNGMIMEVFYNYTNGSLYGNPTKNLIRAIDYADEVAVRFTYQF